MYICLCNPFSDKDVKAYLKENEGRDATVGKVYTACTSGEKPQCCSCLQTLKQILSDHQELEAA